MRRLPFVFALAAAASVPALAQETEILSDFLACDAMSAPAERLTCFDATLKQYKLKYGLLNSSPEAVAKADESRSRAVPRPRVAAEALDETEEYAERSGETAGRKETLKRGDVVRGRTIERAAGPEDLTLPLSTTITGFNANRIGDFRFRIAEGFVFESTGTSRLKDVDLSGRKVVLEKNFLGQWRASVEGIALQLTIKPAS